jgi:Zn finger protein HypA/HybF involved in hydrogenase expression
MTAFSTTRAFIRAIEDTSALHGGKMISRIWLRAGNAMYFKGNTSAYLEIILKGTNARNAEIFIRYGNYAGRCRCCGLVFENERRMSCPECGGISESIALDGSFIIDKIEIES